MIQISPEQKIELKRYISLLFPVVRYPDSRIRLLEFPPKPRGSKDEVWNKVQFMTDPSFILHHVALKRQTNLYVQIATVRANSGNKEDCHWLNALYADTDYGQTGHLSPDNPSEDEVRARIDAFPMPPSILVNSGHGFHAYYLLETPVDLTIDGNSYRMELLIQALGLTLGGDSVQNINRLLRLPYSMNVKYADEPPVLVTIEKMDETIRYKLSDFDELAETAKKPPKSVNSRTPAREPKLHFSDDEKSEMLKSMSLDRLIDEYVEPGLRSQADMKIITGMILKGVSRPKIEATFRAKPCGERYEEKGYERFDVEYFKCFQFVWKLKFKTEMLDMDIDVELKPMRKKTVGILYCSAPLAESQIVAAIRQTAAGYFLSFFHPRAPRKFLNLFLRRTLEDTYTIPLYERDDITIELERLDGNDMIPDAGYQLTFYP